ncbi:MAG: alkane 1-monooxygenase [Burkholderiales bacterium]|nr:alkane 1-monooxygenase [Burkholderiales bacterium]
MQLAANQSQPQPQPDQPYVDRKRYFWLLSLTNPSLAASGPFLYLLTDKVISLWWPVLLMYLLFPLFDFIVGADRSNPPESAVPALEADLYYRWITYLLVPLLWAGYLYGIIFFATHDLPWHAKLAGMLACGLVGGNAINLGHELGHKKTKLERWLARIILALTCYGHFYVEHNRGHHRDVATFDDPASSRMGESIYRFMLREVPGAFVRAWQLERERLAREGRSVFSWRNEIFAPMLLSLLVYGGLTLWLGWPAFIMICGATFFSYFQLTAANYVEHYGLLRQKLPNGRYEVCTPQHSWSSNQLLSNWAVLHLQRHADHHAYPARRFQSLRHFDEAPLLPTGYFGVFTLSYFPPLWFWVMDRYLIKVVEGDASLINFDPRKREKLIAKYQLKNG